MAASAEAVVVAGADDAVEDDAVGVDLEQLAGVLVDDAVHTARTRAVRPHQLAISPSKLRPRLRFVSSSVATISSLLLIRTSSPGCRSSVSRGVVALLERPADKRIPASVRDPKGARKPRAHVLPDVEDLDQHAADDHPQIPVLARPDGTGRPLGSATASPAASGSRWPDSGRRISSSCDFARVVMGRSVPVRTASSAPFRAWRGAVGLAPSRARATPPSSTEGRRPGSRRAPRRHSEGWRDARCWACGGRCRHPRMSGRRAERRRRCVRSTGASPA